MLVLFFVFVGLAIGLAIELVVGLVVFFARKAGRLTHPATSVPFALAGTSLLLAAGSGITALALKPYMSGPGTAPNAEAFYFASALMCGGLFVALAVFQALIGGLRLLWARARDAAREAAAD